MTYINEHHVYTDPDAYDARSKKFLEKYNKKAWDPVIYKTGKQYISATDTVCDFGCGTLAHFPAMEQANRIYAIDTNKAMVDEGLRKLGAWRKNKIEIVIADACNTPLAPHTCSIIWSIGLTEYTNLESLFAEMTRVATPSALMLLQFPSANNLMHVAIRTLNYLRGKKTKKFRTLSEIRTIAHTNNWIVIDVQSAFIRNNLWCVLRKSNPE
ncbi:MAG: hypothetical protein A3E36_02130 [Candidatus Andersenbacteria bacterium RIFCSPHIGHO2_12_FULL_45_11b]|uniref:Methyltransferase type 11 domain-containing protein n=1 Tax=Candidatus Andersenbacteria bacterium RIFCSPHIGHO2_12_FULL_45_11b TaxID=1797282 RepID=A0A1G1XBK2_9BACT|nr:MAG: hypothetical protein A3E36_02130 [Candidatus Andersenbacteria bacterium RIFCSPHIGHO2_12_FULL_45_11b]